jgi:hypothetical protein
MMSTNAEPQLVDTFSLFIKEVKLFIFDAFRKQAVLNFNVIVAPRLSASIHYTLHRHSSYNDGLPIVNRKFALEPRIFSRIR